MAGVDNAWTEGLKAGDIQERKSNSALQQSAWDALLKNDGLKWKRNEEIERKSLGRKKRRARSSTRAGS